MAEFIVGIGIGLWVGAAAMYFWLTE